MRALFYSFFYRFIYLFILKDLFFLPLIITFVKVVGPFLSQLRADGPVQAVVIHVFDPHARCGSNKGQRRKENSWKEGVFVLNAWNTFGQRVSGRVGGLEENLNEVQRRQGLAEDESEGAKTTSERL